jgi:hypothetical protein
MQGKRVNFTARAIITPNAFLDIDQVGVPMKVATTLSIKERVTKRNLHMMRALVESTCWPQAVALHRPDGMVLDLNHVDRSAQEIQVGWTVERNLMNDDYVILNRQPSLHRLNMLGHRVLVHQWDTFMLNMFEHTLTHTARVRRLRLILQNTHSLYVLLCCLFCLSGYVKIYTCVLRLTCFSVCFLSLCGAHHTCGSSSLSLAR